MAETNVELTLLKSSLAHAAFATNNELAEQSSHSIHASVDNTEIVRFVFEGAEDGQIFVDEALAAANIPHVIQIEAYNHDPGCAESHTLTATGEFTHQTLAGHQRYPDAQALAEALALDDAQLRIAVEKEVARCNLIHWPTQATRYHTAALSEKAAQPKTVEFLTAYFTVVLVADGQGVTVLDVDQDNDHDLTDFALVDTDFRTRNFWEAKRMALDTAASRSIHYVPFSSRYGADNQQD
ncbi:hypothetical protein [Ferrimonas marina]|uniref:Uncharacterized protein n=1 Tax=Ferrimonas marina TaxID=299255 RepID=A0A1M5U400_9GAMM|nr:hypothetical protein [Ferrimonas marina]SHH57668.1 hypothetical protein SAMN02745129_2398 [Ferrimonas marina]